MNIFGTKKIGSVADWRDSRASRRLNEKFLDCYMVADRLCCSKFGIAVGGITEYVNRLSNVRYTNGREDVLPKLVRYRGIRNRFAHESGAIKRSDEITKADIKWIKGFSKELTKKRDPISVYLRRERKYERRKKMRRIAFTTALGIIAVLAFALYFVLQKG